jgi:hypothetical protein
MAGERTRLISLLGSTLLALSLATAHASPGSGGGRDDDDFEYGDWDNDNSGSDSGDDDQSDWDDSGWDDNDRDDDDADDHHDNSDSGSSDGGDDDRSRGSDGHERHASSRHSDTQDAHQIERVTFEVEYDELGDAYVAGQVLLSGTRAEIAVARRLGFEIMQTTALRSIGAHVAHVRLPRGRGLAPAMAQLRVAAPGALVVPNTVYRQAQSFAETRTASAASLPRHLRLRGVVGVIDTGVDASKLPTGALARQRGFVGDRAAAHDHGLAVAAIATAHGARVHVADVFGETSDGALAASTSSILAALDWMIENNIAVINISIEGPNNPLLAQMARRAAERGHILVAAAGNGGPTARPAFPAAFDGVVAITAIDRDGRPYLRANRGTYIDFAAEGVDVAVSTRDESLVVSGTSFAAPRIAAELAQHLQSPSPRNAAHALATMRDRAEDMGEPGRDTVYGWGAIRD